jgi:hypothetical protein
MPLYLVKLRQEREFEIVVDAPDADVAQEVARMEALRHSAVIDEQFIVEEVTESTVEAN